jgi:hypothetical protein
MSWTFLLGFIAFSLIFVWLLGVRYQIEVLEDAVGDQELEVSLAERRGEGSAPTGTEGVATGELVGAAAQAPEGRAP